MKDPDPLPLLLGDLDAWELERERRLDEEDHDQRDPDCVGREMPRLP